MSLRVLVLTTETAHHASFVRELMTAGHSVTVVSERSTAVQRPRHSRFQRLQEDFEVCRWFGTAVPPLSDLCPTYHVPGLNTSEAFAVLAQTTADVAISFGTAWIKTEALKLLPRERWNLHGGDPQRYRGLDSHLWALYHSEVDALATTLHWLDADLDRGAIIAGRPIDLLQAPELHMLRAASTDLAVLLTLGSLAYLEAVGASSQVSQATVGRYYSTLPDELLQICTTRYTDFTHAEHGSQ